MSCSALLWPEAPRVPRYTPPVAMHDTALLTPLGGSREGWPPAPPSPPRHIALCPLCLALPAATPCRATSACSHGRADSRLGHVLLSPIVVRACLLR